MNIHFQILNGKKIIDSTYSYNIENISDSIKQTIEMRDFIPTLGHAKINAKDKGKKEKNKSIVNIQQQNITPLPVNLSKPNKWNPQQISPSKQ